MKYYTFQVVSFQNKILGTTTVEAEDLDKAYSKTWEFINRDKFILELVTITNSNR